MFDFEENISQPRTFDKFTIQSYNPHGFWKISKTDGGGKVPQQLDGAFTSQVEAEKAIAAYLRQLEVIREESTPEAKAQKLREKTAQKQKD